MAASESSSKPSAPEDVLEDRRSYWELAWSNGVKPGTRFDAMKSSPALVHLLDREGSPIPTGSGKKALVPGCGRGYDLITFATRGWDAVGLEISESGQATAAAYLSGCDCGSGKAAVVLGDFLGDAAASHVEDGSIDLAFDYTLFCAIKPYERKAWAAAMARVIKKGGQLITLQYPLASESDDSVDWAKGPPFPLTPKLYKDVLEPAGFKATLDEEVPAARSHPRREGRERIVVWERQ